MTAHRALNIALASILALALGCAYLLDGPTPWATAQAMANDAAEAQRQAADKHQRTTARQRFEQAAQDLCGQNAGWQDIGNGVVQCITKHGRKQARQNVTVVAGGN